LQGQVAPTNAQTQARQQVLDTLGKLGAAQANNFAQIKAMFIRVRGEISGMG